MVWFVSGNCRDIALQVSECGAYVCHGGGRHDIRPPGLNDFGSNIDYVSLKRIKDASISWSIFSADADEKLIDPFGVGLLSHVRSASEKPHGMINFFDAPDTIAIRFVLPQAHYFRVQRLLELALKSPSLEYKITIEFLGFRAPEATVDVPTWSQFIAGEPYFFQEYSFAVHRQEVDA